MAVWQLESNLRECGDGSEKKEVCHCVMAVVASLQEITLCVVPVRWSHYSTGRFTQNTEHESRETVKNVL